MKPIAVCQFAGKSASLAARARADRGMGRGTGTRSRARKRARSSCLDRRMSARGEHSCVTED